MSKNTSSSGFGTTGAASLGGKARADALSPEDRSEIARRGAAKRWGKTPENMPKALKEAPLQVRNGAGGYIEFECAVLDNETRVLSERAFARAIGAKRGGSHWQRRKHDPNGANLPVFLSAANLRPYISLELATDLSAPTVYITETGQIGHGIRAELIPQILDVYLKARDAGAGVLHESQKEFARIADILMRGLAATGIVALIDEATGYQDIRAKDALAKVLEAFVQKELRPWVHTFPVEYYKEIYRLKGLEWPPKNNRMPRYIGKFTNDIVYARLAPGILGGLQRNTPRDASGRLKHHLHRRLTGNVGHPKLLQHLGAVVTVMKFADDKDYPGFIKMLDKHYPRQMAAPLFESPDDAKDEDEENA